MYSPDDLAAVVDADGAKLDAGRRSLDRGVTTRSRRKPGNGVPGPELCCRSLGDRRRERREDDRAGDECACRTTDGRALWQSHD